MNSTDTGKYFYFAFVVALASLCTAYRILRKKTTLQICFTDAAVFVFAVWVTANCIINGTNPGMSLWLFLLLIPLYAVIRVSLNDCDMIRPLIWCIVMIVTVEAIWGLLQLYGLLESYHIWFAITGSFFNPGPYAGFLVCGVPLALHCVLNGRRRAEKLLGVVSVIMVGLILPATMSRAAWLAVVAGCIPVILQRTKFKIPNTKYAKIVFFIFVAFLVAGAFFAMYSFKKHSAEGRMLIWRVSADLICKQPATGFGLGSFQVKYDQAQAAYFIKGKGSEKQQFLADTPEYAFNEYIQMMVEQGVAGLLLFLIIVYSIFTKKGKQEKNERMVTAINGSLTAFLVFAFFSYPFSILPLTILFVSLAAMSASLSQPIARLQMNRIRITAGVFCLVAAGYGTEEILTRYPAYREWNYIQTHYGSDECEKANEEYRRLYRKLNREKHYLFEYAQCLSATGQYEKGNELLGRVLLFGSDPAIFCCMGDNYKNTKNYEKAENMYQRASEIVPNRHYPLYLLMKLYHETGQDEKAQLMAKTLLEKPVKTPSEEIREIQEEAKKVRNMRVLE